MSKVKAKAGRSQTATAAEDEVSRDGIQSVNRAFAIMELFDERRPALSVSDGPDGARISSPRPISPF